MKKLNLNSDHHFAIKESPMLSTLPKIKKSTKVVKLPDMSSGTNELVPNLVKSTLPKIKKANLTLPDFIKKGKI